MVVRRVTLVCGPPCGGKSWYVREHAGPGDLVVCVDTYAVQAGSEVSHNHAGGFYRAGEDRFQQVCARLGRDRLATGWVVRCAPAAAGRVELARLVRASQVVVLLPPVQVAYRRARLRDGTAYQATWRAIDSWYRRYQPGRGELVIRR